MQDLKNRLLEKHIILITTQEECDAVNSLLRLGFKILYYGDRGWMLFQFHNSYITIEDNVTIMKIEHISIGDLAIFIDNACIPGFLVNNLKLNMYSNG